METEVKTANVIILLNESGEERARLEKNHNLSGYEYKSVYDEKLRYIEVERTKKGVYLELLICGIGLQKFFISNKRLKFIYEL